jgi:serine/threonine-protein kinase
MRRRRLFALGAIVLLVPGGSAAATEWRSYHNSRFGVTADVPAGWIMQPEPENNEGRIFLSPDGRARLTISGIFATESPEVERAEKAAPLPGETLTYKAAKGNWIVLSGQRGGRVFYRKAMLSCRNTVWNDLDIEYPVEDKPKYDGLAAHAAASLRPGSGYDHKCR